MNTVGEIDLVCHALFNKIDTGIVSHVYTAQRNMRKFTSTRKPDES